MTRKIKNGPRNGKEAFLWRSRLTKRESLSPNQRLPQTSFDSPGDGWKIFGISAYHHVGRDLQVHKNNIRQLCDVQPLSISLLTAVRTAGSSLNFFEMLGHFLE